MCHHRDTGGTRLIAKVVPNAVVTDSEKNYHRDAVVFRDARPAYRLTLAGSMILFSLDYGLLPFIPTSAKKAGLGTIDPARALTITKAYVEAFFGKYLEGRKSPLLDGPSPEYPEITSSKQTRNRWQGDRPN